MPGNMSFKYRVIFAGLLTLALLITPALIGFAAGEWAIDTLDILNDDFVKATVKEIECKHCRTSDAELRSQGLTLEDIKKVRAFCALSTEEKTEKIKEVIRAARKQVAECRKKQCKGSITGYTNSYDCYFSGENTGIPNYADLGLSYSTCSWHDPTPNSCKVEGAVACLWGCTNVDPVLGWSSDTKLFTSRSALEASIWPLGYHYTTIPGLEGTYSRWLSYGYRYEIQSAGTVVINGRTYYKFHSEGPEPSPEFNWYASLRGWWPTEVYVWHDNC